MSTLTPAERAETVAWTEECMRVTRQWHSAGVQPWYASELLDQVSKYTLRLLAHIEALEAVVEAARAALEKIAKQDYSIVGVECATQAALNALSRLGTGEALAAGRYTKQTMSAVLKSESEVIDLKDVLALLKAVFGE